MASKPLVSVLMTAYNREKYISEAIQSVLSSTYKNFELIIVDDASSDNTVAVAKKYEKIDSRVRVCCNERNLGQFPNRNKALQYANGDYIKYFDSDDVMNPDCLGVMVASLEKFPDAWAAAEHHKDIPDLPVVYTPRELYINHFMGLNNLLTIGPSGCIFRNNVFEKYGGFDTKIGILADTLLFLTIAAEHPVAGFRMGTFFWRRHDEQVTIGQENIVDMIVQRREIDNRVLSSATCPLTDEEVIKIRHNLNNILLRKIIYYRFTGKKKLVKKIFENYSFSFSDWLRALFPNYKLTV